MAHPQHPVISGGDGISSSRDAINRALYTVQSTELALDTTLDVLTHGTHILVDASGGAVTISLPDPTADTTQADVRFVVKKVDSSINAVTVDTVGTPTIDGAASKSLASQWDTIAVWEKDSEWYEEK